MAHTVEFSSRIVVVFLNFFHWRSTLGSAASCFFFFSLSLSLLLLSNLSATATATEWIYRVGYTIPLAIIRLVLLLFPLPYHSYTGTAIQCQAVYRLFYGGSIAWFSFQMLAIIMYDPESISSIVINHRNHTREEDAFLSSNHTTVADSSGGLRHVLTRYLLLDTSQSLSSLDHEMRLIWFILILSFLSNWLHLVLLWHVKSSAPQDWKYRKHVLYYYARQRQQQLENGQDDPQQQQQRHQQQRRNGEPDGLFLLDEENQLPPQQQQHRGSLHAAIHPQLRKLVRLPEGYDGKYTLLSFFFLSFFSSHSSVSSLIP